MPQTDHLMSGMKKVPSAPTMSYLQVPSSGTNSPALSHKCYSMGRPSPLVKPKHDHPKTVTFQTGIATTTVIKSTPSEKTEKNNQFSIRWEIQLSALVLFCFFIGLVIPLSMIIMGGIYIFDCPQEIMIPVFLIVCGSTFLASLYGLRKINVHKQTHEKYKSYKSAFWSAVLFQVLWFALGCYWVYKNYEPNYHADSGRAYCDRALYQFAFWMINSIFIVFGLCLIGFIIFVIWGTKMHSESPTAV